MVARWWARALLAIVATRVAGAVAGRRQSQSGVAPDEALPPLGTRTRNAWRGRVVGAGAAPLSSTPPPPGPPGSPRGGRPPGPGGSGSKGRGPAAGAAARRRP